MSPQSKREYVEAVFLRYKKASRSEKTAILDEFCATCNCHRKHAIRVLRKFKRFVKPKHRKRGRVSVYNKEPILKPLKCTWKASNLSCSKRMKVILLLWLPGYIESFGLIPDDVSKALLTISPATIDRLLKHVKAEYKLHGRATTKPGTLLRKQIPIKLNQWDEYYRMDRAKGCMGKR